MEDMRNANKIVVGILNGRKRMEDSDVDGRTLLKWINSICYEDVDWIHLAQDSDQWRVRHRDITVYVSSSAALLST
jgi:hypothetical protein